MRPKEKPTPFGLNTAENKAKLRPNAGFASRLYADTPRSVPVALTSAMCYDFGCIKPPDSVGRHGRTVAG